MISEVFVFFGACLGLVLFGALLVRTILRVAQFLRLSEFVVAFLILAIATSLPELFVGIQSALAHNPALSLGNVIGSNIADLALVGGIVVLLSRGVKITDKLVRRDLWMMVIVATFPLALMVLGGGLSQFDGVLLLAAYIGYLTWLYLERQDDGILPNHVSRWSVVLNMFLLMFSGIALYFLANLVVSTGTAIATTFALSPILIGLVFVSLGTALPELVFGTRAVLAKHPQLAIGDLIGAVIINSLLVLGITALLAPITANLLLFFTSSVFLLFLVILFAVMGSRKAGFSWEEGIVLVLFYILFLIVELNIPGLFA